MFFMSTIMVRCDIIFYRHILTASGGVTTNFAKKNGYGELMSYFCETDKALWSTSAVRFIGSIPLPTDMKIAIIG